MYINTFKYTPKDVSCQLCTEYVKKLGCTALRCPWLAERIEAGVVGYREAVMETFPRDRRLSSRLNLLIKHYPGSLWSNEQHERRMQYQCAVQGYRRRRDTNAYYAAMYLLTSNDDIYRRTANCFCKDGIEFGYRKAGYSKKFLAEHESEITIHKAAKNYFDGLGFKKLPTIKALNTEYAELLAEKKAAYADYRKAREEMKELLTAKANIDRILELDKEQEEANERREKEAEQR